MAQYRAEDEAAAGRGANQAPAAKKQVPDARQPEKEPAPARKIIYTATLGVIVDDFDKAEQQLSELMKKYDVLLAFSEITGDIGTRRTGRWRLRVPPAQLDELRHDLVKLGVPQKNSIDSEDVTDQYHDLEASIANNKSEETALRQLLEKSAGKMEDIVAVRRELSRVRETIDQQEGRLRRLKNLTGLATLNLTLQEIKNYVPPETPSFGSSVRSTFHASLNALVDFGKGTVIAAVGVGPWLPLVLIVIFPIWRLIRRRRAEA
jgi:hypothetical protein